MNRFLALALALLLSLSASNAAPQSEERISPGFGAVAGQVVDSRTRQPVAEATVVAERDDIEGADKIPHATTDAEGKFFITDVIPGRYVIAASKEQDNYPDADSAAFAADLAALPKVSVREGEVTRAITVPIEKGGKLRGVVIDSQTHAPVVQSLIRLTRVDNTKLWLRTGPDINGHFQLVVPARPFYLEVSATDYRSWTFAGNGRGKEPLQVEPEATRELTVLLEKEKEQEK
ncbi:MAG TPA: carboxypeptidase-like regulatory domain-containing protein [Candidatus Sulfotelmatobacter sp.]